MFGTAGNIGRFFLSGAPPFDPSTLAFSGWWKGDDYDGAHVWTRRASAGSSGSGASRNLTDTGSPANAPGYGATLNGHKTVRLLRASTTGLVTGTAIGSFISTADVWSVGCLVKVIDIASDQAPGASSYLNEPLIGDASGYWGLVLRQTGPAFQLNTYPTANELTFSTGAFSFLQGRGVSGGHTQARLNGGAWQDATKNAIGSLLQILEFGFTSQGGGVYAHADVAELFIADQTMSDGDYDAYRGYLGSEYGVSV